METRYSLLRVILCLIYLMLSHKYRVMFIKITEMNIYVFLLKAFEQK